MYPFFDNCAAGQCLRCESAAALCQFEDVLLPRAAPQRDLVSSSVCIGSSIFAFTYGIAHGLAKPTGFGIACGILTTGYWHGMAVMASNG